MYRVEIGVGLTGAMERLVAETVTDARALFPNQAHAIASLAQLAQRRWLEYASGARALPDGRTLHAVSGTYLSSIRIEQDDVLRYVIYSEDPKAEWIEEGFPAWDMRRLLGTSHKVRMTKDGRRYLVIPFRHKTPGGGALGVTMPQEAHAWWLDGGRRSSLVTGHYREASVQDAQTQVTRNVYRWGDRLTRQDVEGMGLDPDSRIGSRLVGMVRFQHNEDAGGSYLTFRMLTEGGRGWMMPRREGYFAARAAYEFVQRQYEGIMRVALEEDVRALGGRMT